MTQTETAAVLEPPTGANAATAAPTADPARPQSTARAARHFATSFSTNRVVRAHAEELRAAAGYTNFSDLIVKLIEDAYADPARLQTTGTRRAKTKYSAVRFSANKVVHAHAEELRATAGYGSLSALLVRLIEDAYAKFKAA